MKQLIECGCLQTFCSIVCTLCLTFNYVIYGVLPLALVSCNEGSKRVTRQSPATTPSPLLGHGHEPSHMERSLSADYLENDYILGPGDVLDIKVFGADEFNRKVRLSFTGYITLPYLGEVRAEGLTVADLEFTIAGLLAEKYLKNPQVSIFIEEFDSKKVTVVGEVGKPQVLKLRRNSSTLFEVLGEVGGVKEQAGKTIYVIRSSPAQTVISANSSIGRPLQASLASNTSYVNNPSINEEQIMVQMKDTVIPININELLEYRNPMANIEIFSGDIVTVPRGQFFFIMGEVEKAGAYPLKEGMTVLRALSMGGRLSPTHKSSNIKLIRRETDGSTTFATLNLKKISKGEEDDVEVLPGDVLVVGKSPVKTVALQTLDLVKATLNAFSSAFAWDAVRSE